MTEDLPYAERVARHLGVALDVVTIDAGRMASDLRRMVAQTLDEPLADPAPLNVLYINQLARKNGFKVLLSGAGRDDRFQPPLSPHMVKIKQLLAGRGEPLAMNFTAMPDSSRPRFGSTIRSAAVDALSAKRVTSLT